MKTKKTISSIVFISVIIVTILYLFLGAKPLAKEYQFTPIWKISTLSPTVEKVSEDSDKMYFRLGKTMGYFTKDGKISLFKSFQDKASISNYYFADYSSSSKDIPFFDSNGNQAGIIESSGYPYFVNDQIYNFLPGGSSFDRCDSKGKVFWRYEGTQPITAFSAKEKYIAAGFSDGTIKVFDALDGNCILNYAPGGSDYPVILGIDITEDGQYIASVSGHEKQRFVLAHREENQPKIIHHTFLNDGMPYRTLVHFTNDGQKVLYGYSNNVGFYNLETNKENAIPLKSKLLSIQETENLVFLLGNNKTDYTVYLIEKSGKLEGTFSFEANTAFIQTNGEELFVGKDNTISRLSITRE